MDRLPPFQFSLDTPSPHLTREEISKAVCNDLIQLDTKKTWMQPTTTLGTKMAHYRENFLQVTDGRFLITLGYIDTHLSCVAIHH